MAATKTVKDLGNGQVSVSIDGSIEDVRLHGLSLALTVALGTIIEKYKLPKEEATDCFQEAFGAVLKDVGSQIKKQI